MSSSRQSGTRRISARRQFMIILFVTVQVVAGLSALGSRAEAADPCSPPVNVIACENSKPGTPSSVWSTDSDATIVGFPTDISANQGGRVDFKIQTTASNYTIDIYRVGYYNGDGARKITSITPSVALPQNQPACLQDQSTGLVDCGNWAVTASWNVPATAVSGVYFAYLERTDNGDNNQIVFVVRGDSSNSKILFQTSDTTWQAYNRFGGNSLYFGGPVGRAYKVSYNRPIANPGEENELWNAEYPMIRWLEANGYDVSYTSGVDTDRRGSELLEHKVFMTVGHDEYWSAQQRTNVEAARAAGVNMMFLAGNDVFWKVRYETSLDPTHTAYRTMVAYKSTLDDAQTDPTGIWTGTWRDARFSPPADGGRPENGLTGTIFMVNGYVRDSMTVPAQYSALRIWRNTSVRNLTAGQVATFPLGTLGYEWNSDLDNGARPPGLIRLSSTTVTYSGDFVLQNNGSLYTPGTATHNLTLYKASSGALIFSAGTVQWSWGLDANHALGDEAADVRMQQATVNVLADMTVQPTTLQPGLVATTASTDTTGPTVTINTPANGATVNTGQNVTISGTASDTGGVVAGVEVSIDGGTTWHAATGTTSWSYQWVPSTLGTVNLQVRAVDDSANIGAAASRSVTVAFQCPCSLWTPSAVPGTPAANDSSVVELGLRFTPDRDGLITAVRFYKGAGNTGTHTGTLWTTTGQQLATVTFTNETATGWQQAQFASPVAVNANTTYIVSYFAPNGHYAADAAYFASAAYVNAPLSAPKSIAGTGNGVYRGGSTGFPTDTYGSTNYWVDVAFTLNLAPPAVGGRSPSSGATSVQVAANVTATFTKSMQQPTIQFTLKNSSGATVPTTFSYDANSRTATLDPTSNLAPGAVYTASVAAGTDTGGITMTGPVTWTFTTAGITACPCSIWPSDTVPAASTTNDSSGVEVGVRFSPTVDGVINGIRFYKGAGNTGTHTGTLWSTGGQLLATATFTNETATGWQQALFSTPVLVSAGTAYIASYYAPAGHYAGDGAYFANAAYVNSPLSALQSVAGAPNGVYRYGSTSGFPGDTYASANYWVDVVFGPDTSAPTVTAKSPASAANNVPPSTNVTATFSKPVQPASIQFTLRDAASVTVPAALTYDATTRVATLNPTNDLTAGATYTASVTAATDTNGNPLAAPVSWSFSTTGIGGCPCTIWPSDAVPSVPDVNDPGPLELGVRFSVTTDGVILGVRFYKGVGNTGTHTGTLWSATGQQLATVTFGNETATGWQQALFSTPVLVTTGTTYIASYYAPNGHYAGDGGYFASNGFNNPPLVAAQSVAGAGNGIYRYGSAGFPTDTWASANYWVDVVYGRDTTPPTVTTKTPTAGATGVAPSTNITATFSETVTAASVQLELRTSANVLVPGALSYSAATRTATLDPNADLTGSATYTAKVLAATDTSGNALAAPVTWTFTTAGVGACPCSLWPGFTVPSVPDVNDPGPLELGVRFSPDVTGQVTGIRFYKGVGNIGTHTGTLWSATGQQLATVTFTGETATGWQQALFSTPVDVTAGTTYIASYYAPSGHYAADGGYFANAAYVNAPLRAPQSVGGAGNGLYHYSSTGFPTDTWGSSNYWVDVVFRPVP